MKEAGVSPNTVASPVDKSMTSNSDWWVIKLRSRVIFTMTDKASRYSTSQLACRSNKTSRPEPLPNFRICFRLGSALTTGV